MYPCNRCPKDRKCTLTNGCAAWREWFIENWRNLRTQFGYDNEEEKR